MKATNVCTNNSYIGCDVIDGKGLLSSSLKLNLEKEDSDCCGPECGHNC